MIFKAPLSILSFFRTVLVFLDPLLRHMCYRIFALMGILLNLQNNFGKRSIFSSQPAVVVLGMDWQLNSEKIIALI